MIELIRMTEVPTFSLPVTKGQYQAHKTGMESIGMEAPKSFCPQDSGVSEKIIETQ
ncbi:hypothetical protein [Chryseobacterium lathyri]|jgi:hypothetical protein|uniref:Uncharacterized protein n=1 Tax=Chryseobacterium lathyri TaxID=395933 RepID=A0A511YER2_9FLAO|nr:hypothetical protein [Chryseobacterium lathyri]GEN73687.1 hypothetical protein CLA01_37590 [Chryseobacterium lathyri]